MNTPQTNLARSASDLQDDFGHRIAARLSAGATPDALPADVAARLQAMRRQALERRKQPEPVRAAQPVLAGAGGRPTRGGDDDPSPWKRGVAALLPLLALAAGLVAIQVAQNERRADDLARVDTQLLADDLPPSAYADPGFVQFLKSDAR
ncbi:MAG: DUF3619 family protein [Xylophilus ampelinus]